MKINIYRSGRADDLDAGYWVHIDGGSEDERHIFYMNWESLQVLQEGFERAINYKARIDQGEQVEWESPNHESY